MACSLRHKDGFEPASCLKYKFCDYLRRVGAGTEIIGMMRIKMRKNFAKLVLCVIIVLSSVIEFIATAVGASPLSDGSSSGSITSTEDGLPSYTDELTEIARGIISWKKSDNGAAVNVDATQAYSDPEANCDAFLESMDLSQGNIVFFFPPYSSLLW